MPVSREAAPVDAVNTTLAVSGMSPEQQARRAADVQARLEQRERKKQQVLAIWWLTGNQMAIRNTNLDTISDADLDEIILRYEAAGSVPQLVQGPTREQEAANKRMQERRERAQRLAEAHNASFFGGMVAPQISPELAYQHPEYVEGVVRDNALVLPNALIGGVGMGTPSFTGALANGMRVGLNTTGNLASKAGQAIIQGGRAVAPVVTNPRWLATELAFTLPIAASAGSSAGDGSSGGISPFWYVAAPAALTGLGVGGYKLWKGIRGVEQASRPFGAPRYFTLWERNPLTKLQRETYDNLVTEYNNAVAAARNGDRAALDALKEKFGYSSKAQIEQRGHMVDNPKYISDIDFGNAVTNNELKGSNAFFVYPERSNKWRNRRNWYVRLPLYSAGVGALLGSLIFTDDAEEGSNQAAAENPIMLSETDNKPRESATIVASPSLYPDDVNIDSLRSVARGVPYVRK